ncbi:MAG: carboxymuconolactone decarboxylase family protein [Candidatus Eisenbacteria bacterium]|nr:carboxymuconolactone decarboxylase family protein [Candidatus Eisenbacteria bacterium]
MSQKIPKFFEDFRAAYPDVAAKYNALSEAAKKAGPLDERTAELVKLGIAMGAGAEGAAHSHARRARAAGATDQQLEHVALLAITTLGFPRAMTGLAWVRDVTKPRA